MSASIDASQLETQRAEFEGLRDATTLHLLPTQSLVASVQYCARCVLALLDDCAEPVAPAPADPQDGDET